MKRFLSALCSYLIAFSPAIARDIVAPRDGESIRLITKPGGVNTEALKIDGATGDIKLNTNVSTDNARIDFVSDVNFTGSTTGVTAGAAIGDWGSGVVYGLNQIVSYAGDLYRANTAHTSSGTFSADTAYWDIISKFVEANKSPDMAGFIQAFAGTSAPTGWALCNGQELSETTYSELFANIGTTWNTFGGQPAPAGGNFRVPNLNAANRYLRAADGTTLTVGTAQTEDTKLNGIGLGGTTTFATSVQSFTNPYVPAHYHYEGSHSSGLSVAVSHTHTFTTNADGSHTHPYIRTNTGPNWYARYDGNADSNSGTGGMSWSGTPPITSDEIRADLAGSDHSHSGTTNGQSGMSGAVSGYVGEDVGGCNGDSGSSCRTTGGAVSLNTSSVTLTGDGTETRPVTAAVNYIIKLYNDQPGNIVSVPDSTLTDPGLVTRDEVFNVGDVKQSVLTEAQFQALNGTTWVAMKGQSVSGSTLCASYGVCDLPDARVYRYLRNGDYTSQGGGTVEEDTKLNGIALGGTTTFATSVQSFTNPYVPAHYHGSGSLATNTSTTVASNSHVHAYLPIGYKAYVNGTGLRYIDGSTVLNETYDTYGPSAPHTSLNDIDIDGSAGNTGGCSGDSGSSCQTTGGAVSLNTSSVSLTGDGTETRPASIVINTFIKVD